MTRQVLTILRPKTAVQLLLLAAGLLLGGRLFASENVPHRYFAQWADLPEAGQFVFGLVYEESEAYHIWAKRDYRDVTVTSGGEYYGIDVNQGYLALQYGINDRWAADFNIGATTMGSRAFSDGNVEETTGLMDWSFGVRYQIWKDGWSNSWLPTATFRAGAVLPGTFNKSIPFAPGQRSAAIEPELLLRKQFGWPGFGSYGDFLYRWNRTTHNDQYMTDIGLFQKIKGWEFDVGYRHMQTIFGKDISFTDPTDLSTIVYPRDPREINDGIEAGFSFTTQKRHWRYGFHSRTTVDGSNTDRKFWVGGSIDIPFGGKKKDGS